ncbi:MAG TPA: penicillin-binding transpeptidase domain-containing protein [Edaphocola sp.]|nr:penicillin-binding transpeptidase domain-containing protein [Edaphocola sp.]
MKLSKLFSFSILGIISIFALSACRDVRIDQHKDWGKVFEKYGITEGAFEYYDNNKERANYYNKDLCSERLTPASTFKIFNSLVALETNVALDEKLEIKFDGIKKYYRHGNILKPEEDTSLGFNYPEWNKDMTMTEAFKISNVPFYQEVARRIGRDKMQDYLDSVQYGNMKIGEQVDNFWLNDTLKISPDEQVGFMKQLYHDLLPFSARTQRIVKGMMLQETHEDYKLYYKTGLGFDSKSGKDVVWVVGFAETIHRLKNPKTKKIDPIPHPYFFTLCYLVPENTKDVADTRLKLLYDFLTVSEIHDYSKDKK